MRWFTEQRGKISRWLHSLTQHSEQMANLGFHFLRLYYKIFTIISHGAGRLQEVLADRLAAYHYGAAESDSCIV